MPRAIAGRSAVPRMARTRRLGGGAVVQVPVAERLTITGAQRDVAAAGSVQITLQSTASRDARRAPEDQLLDPRRPAIGRGARAHRHELDAAPRYEASTKRDRGPRDGRDVNSRQRGVREGTRVDGRGEAEAEIAPQRPGDQRLSRAGTPRSRRGSRRATPPAPRACAWILRCSRPRAPPARRRLRAACGARRRW